MFDGSHRTRRTVDLGGGKRSRDRRAVQTSTIAAGIEDRKSHVLESTLRLREERRKLQLQQRSARSIQCVYRGYRIRKHVAISLTTPLMLVVSMRLSPPLRRFLLIPVKQLLLEYQAHMETIPQMSTVALRRIIPALTPYTHDDERMQRLLSVLMETTQPNMWGEDGFLALIIACQDMLWSNEVSPFVISLWKWSCQAAAALNTTTAMALVAATVLCSPQNKQQRELLASCPFTPEILLASLVECVTTFADTRMQSILTSRVEGREAILLMNSIHFSSSMAVLPLMQHFLTEQPALAVLTSLVACKGVNQVHDMVMGGKQTVVPMEVVSSEEDSDDEEEDDSHIRAPVSATVNPRKSSIRMSRQELQTVPKLDRLYQEELLRLQRDTLELLDSKDDFNKHAMMDLAAQIGDPMLWRQWGTTVLNSHNESFRSAYLTVVNMLLQPCTGLRASSSSPLLSQLAFSREVLEALWRNVLVLVVNGPARILPSLDCS
jgi:hypothetical protein